MNRKIYLVSDEERKISISDEAAQLCKAFSAYLSCIHGDVNIPLPELQHDALSKVADFCEHFIKEPLNEIHKPSTQVSDIIQPQWYLEFFSLEIEELCNIMKAAKFLEISILKEACTAAAAIHGKGKSLTKAFRKMA
ncbi:unnamed protein product [Moneuplotes crassus]|uniref:Uncharacterized protein n=1 Tax=Euplotes crassus TaxID=5936 RepID=A0AAD2D9I4_EUPCR|nr:unnamed protein product [Moneuplotes crassus]